MSKVGGVGLKNLVVIALFTMVFIVMMKVILTKHPVQGVSEVVNAV
jgi:hypothetical protein